MIDIGTSKSSFDIVSNTFNLQCCNAPPTNLNYDKQITMFFSKKFMDSHGVEILFKMSRFTMYSPHLLILKLFLIICPKVLEIIC
jgi:hypothetical protein